jgi:hypothetical protein
MCNLKSFVSTLIFSQAFLSPNPVIPAMPECKIDIRKAAAATYSLFKDKGRLPSAVLGLTHVSGKYHFTKKPFMAEGADATEAVGFRILKLWFAASVGEGKAYPWNSTWNPKIASLTELAQVADYKEVFARKTFDVFVLEASESVKRQSPTAVSEAEARAIQAEFDEVTAYLLQTYAGSGKTFILQNWEGDNALAIKKFEGEERRGRIAAMIAATRAKQAGVDAAKARVGEKGVRVLHALEMNWVPSKNESFQVPLVVDAVVPEVVCDLYSISTWYTKLAGNEAALEEKLLLMQKRAPEKRRDASCFMVGEFGAPESIFTNPKNSYADLEGDTGAVQLRVTKNQIEAMVRFGARYGIYWELYCNEWRKNVTPKAPGVDAVNDDLNGFWLIRPDGTKAPVWHYFHELFRLEKEGR